MIHGKNLDLLADRSYKSYGARLEASKRLRRIGNWWNAAQFSLASALIFVSIVFIVSDTSQTSLFAAVIIIFSILSLIVSIVVTFLDYSARATSMSINYRDLQAFSVRIESVVNSSRIVSDEEMRIYHIEYDSIMDRSENHTPNDYAVSQARKKMDPSFLLGARSVILPIMLIAVSCFVLFFACLIAFSSNGNS